MAEYPVRRGYDPVGEETGWGSPMPAEYGSLTAFLPPLEEAPPEEARPRSRGQSRGRNRREAPAPSPNGAISAPRVDPEPAGLETFAEEPAAAAVAAPAPASPARSRSRRRGAPAPPEPETWIVPPGGSDSSITGRQPQPNKLTAEAVDALGAPGRRRRRQRPQWAQSRRTVRHLDVWTVAKVSLVFYVLILGAVVVASVMLWYIADAVGSTQSIEKSVRTLFDLSKFTLHPSQVATYTSIGGGVLAVSGTLANILAALMYNLISDLVGGIRFDVVDDAK
jgi:hypothetical protein